MLGTGWENWKKINVNDTFERKEPIYYRQIPERGTDFEEGKQYLVFMSYNEENDIYKINDVTYGIMEYDPATQMVKNIDTGEFVEIDWSLIK